MANNATAIVNGLKTKPFILEIHYAKRMPSLTFKFGLFKKDGVGLKTTQFNAAQQNAIAQYNAGQANALNKFNSELASQRDQFETKNKIVIDGKAEIYLSD